MPRNSGSAHNAEHLAAELRRANEKFAESMDGRGRVRNR